MAVTELKIQGYRSVRDLTISLKRVNVIVGPNGCGKSNLYNSVALLHAAAKGQLAKALATEGGMPSILWAGPRKEGPVRVTLTVSLDEYEYTLALGLPVAGITMFALDPIVKQEKIVRNDGRRKTVILDRTTSTCNVLDAEGKHREFLLQLSESESAMDQISDPTQFPLLDDVRRRISKWRFYHTFRTDAESPLRRPQVAVRTPVMSSDGLDLAAALQTIIENGDGGALHDAIADAFHGSRLTIVGGDRGLVVQMLYDGFNRPLSAHELSDGTLRYLCLLAALLSPRPAPLIALNEPETSLHESLLPPLGRLIAKAAETSQVWLTTHSATLATVVQDEAGVMPIKLDKVEGETVRAGRPKGVAFSAEYDL